MEYHRNTIRISERISGIFSEEISGRIYDGISKGISVENFGEFSKDFLNKSLENFLKNEFMKCTEKNWDISGEIIERISEDARLEVSYKNIT